jgi:anti-sigma factor RsiW
MGLQAIRSAHCERARQWISSAADGELSEVERRLLLAHLSRCPDCGAFRCDVEAITRDIRAASLEPLGRPIELPVRRRLSSVRAFQLAAASAAAVAVGLGAPLLGVRELGQSGRGSAPTFKGAPVDANGYSAYAEMQLIQHLRHPVVGPSRRNGPL